MKKTNVMYTILTMMVFALGFSASGETEEMKEEKKQFMEKTVGTYVITDEDGVTYTININDDMTMTAEANGKTYYGSWTSYSNDLVEFKFSGDTQEHPRIQFKSDKKEYSSSFISNDFFIANDGFLYADGYYKAQEHNPDYRLKIRKTK